MKDISHSIARKLLKVAKKEDENELSEWGKLSPGNAVFLERLKTYWNEEREEQTSDRLISARERLHTRIFQIEWKKPERTLLPFFFKIAATILVLLSVSGLFFYMVHKNAGVNKSEWFEIATEAGQRSKVILPDGSLVWLNAETTVRYQPDGKERKVLLSGEAYFEVTHSTNYPFVVLTGNSKIRVLGTKFDVSHYPDSKQTTASLLSGKITMTFENKNGQSVELKPGEKIVYDIDRNSYLKTESSVQDEMLWKQGTLVFDNEPFDQLVKNLERYYAVTINYKTVDFCDIHYTGTIENLSITKVFDFINLTIPISYEVNNKTITLQLRKE